MRGAFTYVRGAGQRHHEFCRVSGVLGPRWGTFWLGEGRVGFTRVSPLVFNGPISLFVGPRSYVRNCVVFALGPRLHPSSPLTTWTCYGSGCCPSHSYFWEDLSPYVCGAPAGSAILPGARIYHRMHACEFRLSFVIISSVFAHVISLVRS